MEFDVHPTTDGRFVVFHDWTLDCRTNGKGVTREHDLAALKALDIGYGYTADGGKTFPFRGKGIGLMPTLDEVLARFPDRRFLINIKSDDVSEGERLAAAVGSMGRRVLAMRPPEMGPRDPQETQAEPAVLMAWTMASRAPLPTPRTRPTPSRSSPAHSPPVFGTTTRTSIGSAATTKISRAML